jgi:tetratricopeptide (TPR) repeat protein
VEPFTTLAVAGISWIATTSATGIVEGLADRTFVAVAGGLRERLPALAGQPEGRDLARGVRQAQLSALKRLIEDYRAKRRWARFRKGSDQFSEHALKFYRSAAEQSHLPSFSGGQALLRLAPPLVEMDGVAAGVAAIENAVLTELALALDGIPVPTAFVDHFRNGRRGTQRFVELFRVYLEEQVTTDDAFRDVLYTRLHLENAANLAALRDWLVQVEARFTGTLVRVETGIADVAAQNRAILEEVKRLAREKGVSAASLRSILEKLGESGVEDEDILTRLSAKADEYLALREQLSTLAKAMPNASAVLLEGNRLLDAGDLDGARRLFADARAALDATHARDKAALLAAEAGIDRLQLHYREAADHYEEAELLVRPFDADARFDYLCQRALALQEYGVHVDDTATLVEAVSLWNDALQLRPRSESPPKWAAIQNNLGRALCNLGTLEGSKARVEEAIVTHRAALEELTRERVPLEWASTQDCIGRALLVLGWLESDTGRLEEAFPAYRASLVAHRASLEERTRERVPLDWAVTQNNLGTALVALGRFEGGNSRLEEAVAAHRAALAERPRERVPLFWAFTQSKLGYALWILGMRERGTVRLEEAVTAYRASLEELPRERMPASWAITQRNLGVVLQSLGERESDTARFTESVAAFRAALEEQPRERVPLQWATTQGALGTALQVLGEREGDAARLNEAVAAHHAALEENTRERYPLRWAMTQYGLGNALRALGARERGTARLEEAVAAYRAALEEQTWEQGPSQWPMTQLDLGTALLMLGERENGTARLNEAIACLRSSSEVLKTAPATFEATIVRAHLTRAQLLLGFRMIVAYDGWCRPP